MKKIKLINIFYLLSILIPFKLLYANDINDQDNNKSSIDQKIANIEVKEFIVDKPQRVSDILFSYGITFDEFNQLNSDSLSLNTQLNIGDKIYLPNQSSRTTSNSSMIDPLLLPEIGNSLSQDSVFESTINKSPIGKYTTDSAEQNVANILSTAAQEDWDNFNAKKLKNSAENYLANEITSTVNSQLNKTASDFLGKFGKAQVNISVDKDGKLQQGSFHVLSPLYDQSENLIFSQVGVHEQGSGKDSRIIGNFGLGYRYETNNWLAGTNIFIDHDFTGSNTRFGLGGELWMDYAKLSTNLYAPLSKWKESSIMKEYEKLIYDERPAKGFDIRAQAYLPSYPHIGGSLVFEKYFGDEVALFGTNERQKDPHALEFGLNYTPVPLITADLSHKIGKGGLDDTRLGLKLNLQLGTPIEKQLDPANVALARSLKGSRYDLVDRNYDIVFEYRQEDFSVLIDGPTSAMINEQIEFKSNINSRSAITDYKWIVLTPTGIRKEPRSDEGNQNRQFVFTPQVPGVYNIALQITTERGHVETSNTITVNVDVETGSSISWVNGFNKANVLDSITLQETEILALPFDQKLQLDFITLDANHEYIEINDPELLWRVRGDSEWKPMDSGAFNQGIRALIQPITNQSNETTWRFHIVANQNFDGNIIQFIARSQSNLTIISGNLLEGIFEKEEETFLDPANLIFEIYQIEGPGSTFTGSPVLISRGGAIDGNPIGRGMAQDILVNNYYELVVKKVHKLTGEHEDVTDYIQNSIRWIYIDPATNQEIVHEDINALATCRGYPIFATQITNYESNNLGFGSMIENNKHIELLNEQQLLLSARINYKQIQEPELAKKGNDRFCLGDNGDPFHAEDGYIGYKGENKEERIASLENRRAGEWK